jgi:hypothetical protein
METFATTFAPIQDESEAEKIILDLIRLGFALVASPYGIRVIGHHVGV